MQSSHFPPSDFRRATVSSWAVDRFPNAPRFAPIFSGRETPTVLLNAPTGPNAAFFSEFEPPLVEAARRLTAPTAELFFERFGFATPDDFARRFASADGDSSETLLFADARGARFLLVAPTATLRLLFDAALGFDVATLCANEALWNDFNADAQTPLTPFEEDAFKQTAVCFATLSPLAHFFTSPTPAFPANPPTSALDFADSLAPSSPFASDAWRLVSFSPTSTRVALELDDDLFYWERRAVRLSGRLFPWTVVFPTRRLASLAEAALFRESPNASFASVDSSSLAPTFPATRSADVVFSPPLPNARTRSSVASSGTGEPLYSAKSSDASSSVSELAVVVERSEMPREAWLRLKPGDILTTNVPANALFLGLVDDSPRFLCRPGLFRGAAAVQIQGRADDDRE